MDKPDPADVLTVDDFTARLCALHQSAGAPSLRTLERWAAHRRAEGRPEVALPRSTVADILAGKRLPSDSFLDSFIEACGVSGAAKEPWLAARARLAAPLPRTPSPSPSPPAHRRRRHVATAAGALLLVVVAVPAASSRVGPRRPAATIGCDPPSCRTTAPRLAVHGRVAGRLPSGTGVYLLTRVESTHRWYLGTEVTPTTGGAWAADVGVGNPLPQPHDREFTICVYLLPDDSTAGLADRQIAYAGAGLPEADLPPGRTRLACTAARRLAQPG